MKTKTSIIAAVMGVALASASVSALAVTDWAWTLSGAPSGGSLPGVSTITGYSDTGTSPANSLVAFSPLQFSGSSTYDKPGSMSWFDGGVGICSTTDGASCPAPQHAIDNMVGSGTSGGKESVLLTFTKSVALTWLDIGYLSGDADITVLAYTGMGAPTVTGSTYGALTGANGWTVVGNYADLSTSNSTGLNFGTKSLVFNQSSTSADTTPGTSVSSSYWLIAAYNSSLPGASGVTCTDKNGAIGNGCTNSDDTFKLYAVAGRTATDTKVSEPSALLLVGTALMGVIGLRRREKSIQA